MNELNLPPQSQSEENHVDDLLLKIRNSEFNVNARQEMHERPNEGYFRIHVEVNALKSLRELLRRRSLS